MRGRGRVREKEGEREKERVIRGERNKVREKEFV